MGRSPSNTLQGRQGTPTIGLVGGAGNDVLIGPRTPTSAPAIIASA
jgi:hypothetical protein